jgi:hypothetical protein
VDVTTTVVEDARLVRYATELAIVEPNVGRRHPSASAVRCGDVESATTLIDHGQARRSLNRQPSRV